MATSKYWFIKTELKLCIIISIFATERFRSIIRIPLTSSKIAYL